MTRRQAREAYKEIQLSKQEKDVLLNHILSASGVAAPGGKDRNMRKRKYRPAILAAIVALMVLLMGCAWVAIRLDGLKMGEYVTKGEIIDSENNVVKETELIRDVISLQGLAGTPSHQAAAEWYAYEQDYLTNHWEKIQNDFQVPEAYQAYSPGNQEMVDKLDEICEKYGLQLAGERIFVETWHDSIMLKILDIEYLVTDAVRDVEHLGGYFYACGNFKHEFEFYLDGTEASWQYPILGSVFYHDKDYLDTVYWTVNTEDYRQWNYTCSDGTQVLIVTTGDVAEVLCDREDAFLSVHVFTSTFLDDGTEVRMTDRDLELIAEAIDFSVKPRKPDMEAAQKQLDEMTQAYEDTKPERKPFQYREAVQWQINNRYSDESLYYCLYDFDEDGSVELLLGYAEEFTFIFFTNVEGEAVPGSPTEEDWAKLEALWPTLDITPVEEFPFDEY